VTKTKTKTNDIKMPTTPPATSIFDQPATTPNGSNSTLKVKFLVEIPARFSAEQINDWESLPSKLAIVSIELTIPSAFSSTKKNFSPRFSCEDRFL
jgi:hypothetical protein